MMMTEYQKVGAGKMDLKVAELNKAKEFIKGHFVLDLEDSRSVASMYAHEELLEKEIDNPAEIIKKVDAVTLEQVEAAGKEFFVEKGLNLALIGNFEDRQKLESLLKL